ncbi:MAG: (Fe-S)-binding protein [Nitrososphaerales archaeon]
MGYRLAQKLQLFDAKDMEKLTACVHCGLCLSHCPTYNILGIEPDSPRGRLYLMKNLNEGRINPDEGFIKHMQQCLSCRACEAICPSDVEFGRLMGRTRSLIDEKHASSFVERTIKRISLRGVIPHRRRLRLAMLLLGLVASKPRPIQRIIHGSTKSMVLSSISVLLNQLPRLPRKGFQFPKIDHSKTTEPTRKVALLSGCVMDSVFPRVNEATVRVLMRNGCEVLIPAGQNCCGAVHHHNGDLVTAAELAKKNIDAFERAGADRILVNSAGCGAQMKEYWKILENDPEYADRAKALSLRVSDVVEFLAERPLDGQFQSMTMKVTYQDPCHMVHVQGIRKEPRALLSAIPGLELVEMEGSDSCCGGAGTYAITQRQLSERILDEKMNNVSKIEPDAIITANPPCLMQFCSGVKTRGMNAEVLHIVELLDRAYTS